MEDVLLEGCVVRPEQQRNEDNKGLTSMGEFSYSVLDPKGKGKGDRLRELVEQPSLDKHKGASLTSDTVVAVGPEL